MATASDLISASLIERDTNNDVLWTWSYPSITPELRTLLMRKCGLENGLSSVIQPVQFRYCHHQQSWFYLELAEVSDSEKLPKVRQFVLVLQTKDFSPEKYEILAKILSKTYSKTGNPAIMLQLYLSVIIRGSCTTEENGTFLVKDFDQKSLLASSPIKSVIKTYGLETILIYTALILKKRVIVYHHRLDTLLNFLKALPALVWHRQNWNILYPYMELTDIEIAELTSLPTYAAGFRDAAVESRSDLYDVYVNLAAIEITVAPHAKETFAMTKTHKDIAVFMLRQAENEELNDQQVVKELAGKTRELLSNLKTLASTNEDNHPVVTLEALKEKKLAPALENFLWNLSVAEGLVHI